MERTMEWWEAEEPVEEFGIGTKNRIFANRMTDVKKGPGTMVGYTRGDFGNAKFVSDKSVKKGAAIAGAGLAAGAALKYGVSKYRANKAKEAQQKQQAQNAQAESGTNCESWIDDPAAQEIMESYFSEFADADCYNDNDEWN